jgi:hypothetical protein
MFWAIDQIEADHPMPLCAQDRVLWTQPTIRQVENRQRTREIHNTGEIRASARVQVRLAARTVAAPDLPRIAGIVEELGHSIIYSETIAGA